MTSFTESTVEDAAFSWLEGLGYEVCSGQDIAPGISPRERCNETTDRGELR
ncbi:MAG: hypothetical protein WD208_03505 [Dehalococcoidia bacterium]